ncbi:MAG: acyl-CoA thioesterase [Selenomonadaceae bacterium]|nr:acyl-CoA thioesterase [Selenomonadaceae bacterium]
MTITTKHKVHFYDTDTMSVVHHSNYIRWFEIGRVEYLRKIGISLNDLMADGILFPITKVEAQFHSPAHFDDDLDIITTAVALTKAKMEFDYEIRRGDKLLVTGHTQNVFTSKSTGKITRLPDKYYSLMNSHSI